MAIQIERFVQTDCEIGYIDNVGLYHKIADLNKRRLPPPAKAVG